MKSIDTRAEDMTAQDLAEVLLVRLAPNASRDDRAYARYLASLDEACDEESLIELLADFVAGWVVPPAGWRATDWAA